MGADGLTVTVQIVKDGTGAAVTIPSSQVTAGTPTGWYNYTTTVLDTSCNTLAITATATDTPTYYQVYSLVDTQLIDSSLAVTVDGLSTAVQTLLNDGLNREGPLSLGEYVHVGLEHFSYDEPILTFTSQYSVLYAAPMRLRSDLGEFIEPYSDEELYYQLFLSSIEANTLFYQESLTPIHAIRPIPAQYMTSEIQRWTIASATVALLTKRLAELAATGTIRHQLGDFAYSTQYDTSLEQIRTLLDEARAIVISSVRGRNAVRDAQLGGHRHLSPIFRHQIGNPKQAPWHGPAGTPASDNLFDPEM